MTMGEVTMQTGGSASVLALDIKRALDVPSSATAFRPFGSLALPALVLAAIPICHLSSVIFHFQTSLSGVIGRSRIRFPVA